MKSLNKKYIDKTFAYLHSIPELPWQEHKTSKFIAEELETFGYEVSKNVAGRTGIVAILDSGLEGPIFALRADMDALEFENEEGKYSFHACGHDANSTMVLAAAKEISEKGIKRGKLYLIFQPAEEILEGAKSIIESGLIDEVEEMAGIHLRPKAETRLGAATPALLHGSGYRIVVKVRGLNAHGARPHLGINAIDAAVQIVNGINAIHLDPAVPHSIKVTRLLAGGDTINTIPDSADIAMDLRAQDNETMTEMLEKAKMVIENSAKAIGAEVDIEYIGGVPAADYDDEMVEEARIAIESVLGEALEPMLTVGGEDFHFYSKDLGIKTAYIGLGADLEPGLHHEDMSFDKKALYDGVAILKKIVENKLR